MKVDLTKAEANVILTGLELAKSITPILMDTPEGKLAYERQGDKFEKAIESAKKKLFPIVTVKNQ